MSGDERSSVDDWFHLPPLELMAGVFVAPAPEIALASLRPILTPVRNTDGELVDWWIDVAALFDDDPTGAELSDYRTWRQTWHREWPIGPITNVASLRDEAANIEHDLDRHLDGLLDQIVAADGSDVTVHASSAAGLLQELETVRLALSVDERTGFGLIDDMPSRTRSAGLARTWAPTADEVVFAATPSTSLVLHPTDGLVLVHGDGETAITFAGVTAVDMRADAVLAMNERGATMRMGQADARPLGWMVPRSLRWHVREVPIVAVWSLLFEGLSRALQTAAERDTDVQVGAGAVAMPSGIPPENSAL
jgi:hypothetical protein